MIAWTLAGLSRRGPMGVLLCCAGAAVFWKLGAPAPWLTGSAVTGAALALAGSGPKVPWWLADAALLVLGVSLGNSVGPDSLAAAARWPLSLAALLLTVPLVIGSAQLVLTRLFGWERRDAFLAAVPGALSYTLAIAVHEGLDVRRIAIAQSVRLMAIVVLVPLIFGAAAKSQVGAAAASAGDLPLQWLSLLAAGCGAGLLLRRFGAPAPLMIGGLLMSCLAHMTAISVAAIPPWLLAPAVILIGTNIGARFAGSDRRELTSMLAPALASTAMTFLMAAASAVLTAKVLGLPMLEVLLAFAPGGLDSIAVLVLNLKLDAVFVTVHQLLRFLGIAATLPMLFRLWQS